MSNVERPNFVLDEHLEYLDALRESGVTNMFGATSYLINEFGLDRAHAISLLSYWMQTFSERHQKKTNESLVLYP